MHAPFGSLPPPPHCPVARYSGLDTDAHLTTVSVSVAGRLMLLRSSSAKLQFYTLHADGAKVQIMMNFEVRCATRGTLLCPWLAVVVGAHAGSWLPPWRHSPRTQARTRACAQAPHTHFSGSGPTPPPPLTQHYGDKAHYEQVVHILRRGDIIGVEGAPAKSKKGELSIIPTRVTLLSPCLHMLPKVQGVHHHHPSLHATHPTLAPCRRALLRVRVTPPPPPPPTTTTHASHTHPVSRW